MMTLEMLPPSSTINMAASSSVSVCPSQVSARKGQSQSASALSLANLRKESWVKGNLLTVSVVPHHPSIEGPGNDTRCRQGSFAARLGERSRRCTSHAGGRDREGGSKKSN